MQLSKPRVVIIGAGFGGLTAAKNLKNANVDVVLIDKTNHHLFQPLLYQVAVSALSPGDIANPVRTIFRGYKNVQVIMNEAFGINLNSRTVELSDGFLEYDYLILAPGSRHSYFGHNEWEEFAPGLKSIQDALKIRENILLSFEKAERHYGTPESAKFTTFVIVGGGPTGVELAGAISEIARDTLLPDFPLLKPEDVKVILVESGSKLLSSYTPELSDYTAKALKELGVTVVLNTRVTDIGDGFAKINNEFVETANIIWAAGNEASPLLKNLGVDLDRRGRVEVNNDLTVPGYDNVFVIGDSAKYNNEGGVEVPAVAQGAIQMATYATNVIKKNIAQSKRKPFKYNDKGNLATIGRAKAIAQVGKISLKGFPAWLFWSMLHIYVLIDFRNRLRVMWEWIWYYITNKPGARLIVYKSLDKVKVEE